MINHQKINRRRNYKLQSEISHHRSAQRIVGGIDSMEDETVWVPGIRNEDLREMFVSLSRGKGFIDIKTLYRIVKESKLPVSEHQIMQFFYQCDIFEDGNSQIQIFIISEGLYQSSCSDMLSGTNRGCG